MMLSLGVVATLGPNAYSGSAHGAAGMMLACWPAVAFIGSTETALSMTRRAARTVMEPVTVTTVSAVTEAAPDAATEPVR